MSDMLSTLRKPMVITVASYKGGVGKSTTAVPPGPQQSAGGSNALYRLVDAVEHGDILMPNWAVTRRHWSNV